MIELTKTNCNRRLTECQLKHRKFKMDFGRERRIQGKGPLKRLEPIPEVRSPSPDKPSHAAKSVNPFLTLDVNQIQEILDKLHTPPPPTPKPRKSKLIRPTLPTMYEEEPDPDSAELVDTEVAIAITPTSEPDQDQIIIPGTATVNGLIHHDISSTDDSSSSTNEELDIPSLDRTVEKIMLRVMGMNMDSKKIDVETATKKEPMTPVKDSRSAFFNQNVPDVTIGTWKSDMEKVNGQGGESVSMNRAIKTARRARNGRRSNPPKENTLSEIETSNKNSQLYSEWKIRHTKMMERSCDNQLKLTLIGCGLQKYEVNFRIHQISYLDFLRLTAQDLKDLGISNFDDRILLLKKINEISSGAFPIDGKPCPSKLRQHLTDSEKLLMLNDLVEHVKRVTGVKVNEANNGITKIHQFVRDGRMVIEIPTMQNPDPVGKTIKASDGLLQECKKFNKSIGDLKKQITGKECNGIKSDQNIQAVHKSKKKLSFIETIFTQRQFILGTILLGIGTASFFGLKKLRG